MKLTYLYHIVFFCFLLSTPMFAQERAFTKDNLKQFPELKEAKKYLKKGNYYSKHLTTINVNAYANYAIFYYKKAFDINPNSAELNFKLAKSYLLSINKKAAKVYAEKAYALNPNLSNDLLFTLGAAYQYNGMFDDADRYYQSYITNSSSKDSIKLAQKRLEETKNARIYMANPVDVKITPLDVVNTQYAEYATVVNKDSAVLYFTSRRPLGKDWEGLEDGFYENVYSSRLSNQKWGEPQLLDNKINKGKRQDKALIGFNADYSKIYIYSSKNNGAILEGDFENGEIKKMRKMPSPINKCKYNESHISFAKDGKTAYFISERKGGLGGRDVWKTQKNEKNKWSNPENLGAKVNSPFDEDVVFVHPEGNKLYVSSKGFNSMGGYDIFVADIDSQGNVGELKNLGYPINNYDDDLYFSVDKENGMSYFSSIRPDSKGLIDIYVINLNPVPEKDNLVVCARDKATKSILTSNVLVLVMDEKGNVIDSISWNAKNSNIVSLLTDKAYKLKFEAKDYVPYVLDVNLTNPKTKVDSLEVFLNKIVKEEVVTKVRLEVDEKLRYVYFNVNQFELTAESKQVLDGNIKILKKNKMTKVEVVGFTDDTGSLDYNLKLSDQRANSVVSYLVKNGIAESRISVHGEGDKDPAANNKTEEGRSLNRRTEIRIIK